MTNTSAVNLFKPFVFPHGIDTCHVALVTCCRKKSQQHCFWLEAAWRTG